ncbi:hypothetical protein SCP_0503260 [Sparassis crispa]|uniref:Zinc/iron permease n=1 Tax=Sparassis crispa TaxID=139825 RepID=A0A401GM55_9APHY|nr:hypothetical protein SCP_0503260 [Sparassis crispa]GBE83278.1 hypothetical protein SCP_0503260 [Sparassis crispa]
MADRGQAAGRAYLNHPPALDNDGRSLCSTVSPLSHSAYAAYDLLGQSLPVCPMQHSSASLLDTPHYFLHPSSLLHRAVREFFTQSPYNCGSRAGRARVHGGHRHQVGLQHSTRRASTSSGTAARVAKSPGGASSIAHAYPLTLGLVLHALTDGLALGASALSSGANVSAVPSWLSLVVFVEGSDCVGPDYIALGHSAPPCTVQDAPGGVQRGDARRGARVVRVPLVPRRAQRRPLARDRVAHSGGTFLYVATIVQPVRGSSDGLGTKIRTLLIVLGMFIPFADVPRIGYIGIVFYTGNSVIYPSVPSHHTTGLSPK